MQNIVTYKIKYSCSEKDRETILAYLKNYNNVLRFTYNRLKDALPLKLSTKEVTALHKTMNNIFIDSQFCNSAFREAKRMLKGNEDSPLIFGGKNLWKRYNKQLITKEEYLIQRLNPIYSIGEAKEHSNKKFRIINENEICFQPCKNVHITLNLTKQGKHWTNILYKLKDAQTKKAMPICYKLDLDYIYIIFDMTRVVSLPTHKPKQDRLISLDFNPNYIGYTVCDWNSGTECKILDAQVISIKPLHEKQNNTHICNTSEKYKYFTRKKKHEICNVAQRIVSIAKHYKCAYICIENICMNSKDFNKGKVFNKCVNRQWNRLQFFSNLEKHALKNNIFVLKLDCAYSSYNGNILFRKTGLPDMCLAALEIGRRGYEFSHQYLLKDQPIKKNIIFPEIKLFQESIHQSLEELKIDFKFNSLVDLYKQIKNTKLRYRVQLDENKAVFSKFSTKSLQHRVKLNSTGFVFRSNF